MNSAGTAWLVSRMVPGIDVFGGIILNTGHGGLNPRAVKTALHYGAGAKFVSFGAHSTYLKASTEGRLVDGKPVLLKDLYAEFAEEELSRAIRVPLKGPILSELAEILQLMADHPGDLLNTGHVSGAEALRLIDLAEQFGIKKVLVAGLAVGEMTLEQQKEAAKRGAFLERSFAQYVGTEGVPKPHYYVESKYTDEISYDPHNPQKRPGGLRGLGYQITAIGVEHIILDTDYRQYSLPPPVEGMRQFIACLLDMGFTPNEIQVMTSVNPAQLLGLT